jgi:hypothetical protein
MKVRLLLCLVLLVTPACATHAPPTLSPAGQAAYTNTRILKGIDVFRDTAILANSTTPPQLSTATTRKVVTWHRSAVVLINQRTAGWPAGVQTALDELVKDLPPADAQTLAPYVALVHTLLTETTR